MFLVSAVCLHDALKWCIIWNVLPCGDGGETQTHATFFSSVWVYNAAVHTEEPQSRSNLHSNGALSTNSAEPAGTRFPH